MGYAKETYGNQTAKDVITNTPNQPNDTIIQYIEKNRDGFKMALGSMDLADRMVRIVITAVKLNPDLQKCAAGSIVAAAMTSAQINIMPNTPLGHAWLVPYYDSKKGQHYAQFQLGYKGILDLFYRSPMSKVCYAKEVRSMDKFMIYEGSRMEVIHEYDTKVPMAQRGDVIGYYCVAELTTGARNIEYSHIDDIMAHAERFSKGIKYKDGNLNMSSPWNTARSSMCKKTVALATLNYMPMAVELRTAIAQDNIVRKEIIQDVPILDVPGLQLEEGNSEEN